MRTQLLTGALAVAATSALIGLGTAPGSAQTLDPTPDPMTPGVTHERGILMACTGDLGSRPVRVNLYENRTYGNYLEVQLGEGGGADEVGVSRQVKKPFVTRGSVRAAASLDGTKVRVTGTAVATTKVKKVREVVEDAGLRIVSKGTHTRLRDDLVLTYGTRSAELDCGDAFVYRLTVTKTSIVD
ncbi:hypothetical protein GCM10009795_018410 [Nocardioides hankookensis]|uniref:Secreted protein n=1 Tax=Nocardioides hankookensis TaxID=443157 RepID=A0ABW1LKP7_9ACTN